jgi:hypothetical protein
VRFWQSELNGNGNENEENNIQRQILNIIGMDMTDKLL